MGGVGSGDGVHTSRRDGRRSDDAIDGWTSEVAGAWDSGAGHWALLCGTSNRLRGLFLARPEVVKNNSARVAEATVRDFPSVLRYTPK